MSVLFFYLDTSNLNNENSKIKLDFNDANLGSITVQQLKDRLSSVCNLLNENYDLTFFGRLLSQKNAQLSAYGIRSGACLFVITYQFSKDQVTREEKPKIDQAELQKLITPIRTALVKENFRTMLNRLYDKEFRENIVECTPELRDNIVAFAILQDPELMMICTEKENLDKIAEKYSVFAEVASQLATAFHEDELTNSSSNSNTRENAYSMDHESDDDLVDPTSATGQIRESQPNLQNRITLDILQQAILAANNDTTSNQQSTTRSNQNPTQNLSFSSLSDRLQSTSSPTIQTTANQTSSQRDWSAQLITMHELGFVDDRVSIQALEVTNGNVQEAIVLLCEMTNQ